MNTLIIKIEEASDGEGFLYDIYESEQSIINGDDSLDGGQCTTTIENALDMAYSQAKDLLAIKNK